MLSTQTMQRINNEVMFDDLEMRIQMGCFGVNSILSLFEEKTGTKFTDEEAINDELDRHARIVINIMKGVLQNGNRKEDVGNNKQVKIDSPRT